MSSGTGFGKLLLFGEHAAVFGHPAVGMALPLKTQMLLQQPGTPPARRSAEVRELDELVSDAAALLAPESEVPRSLHAPVASVESTVPIGVGLGSSAALTVAVVRAVAAWLGGGNGRRISDGKTWRFAHELERRYHGTPSGIDTGLAALGGARVFRKRGPLPAAERLRTPDIGLIVATLPRTSTTRDLVAGVRTRLEHDREPIGAALDRLGQIAETAAAHLADDERTDMRPDLRSDAEVLGRLATEAQKNLRTIGVSSDTVEEAIESMTSSGAVGAKLSGAGGGGAVFGIFESVAAALEAKTRVENNRATHVWVIESRREGVILTDGM